MPRVFYGWDCRRATFSFACPRSEYYVFYSTAKKHVLTKKLYMVPVTIPSFSIFVGDGRLQHAGAGWEGMYYLRYHDYFILYLISVKDTISVVYGTSF